MKRKKRPWWLRSRDEICAACGQPYALGIGVRCVDCDSDLCPVCVAFIEAEAFCAECPPKTQQRSR